MALLSTSAPALRSAPPDSPEEGGAARPSASPAALPLQGAAASGPLGRWAEDDLLRHVVNSLRRIVGRGDPDFDDLVQVSFENVWKSLGSFEGRSSISTWIFRVCYRTVLSHRRFFRRLVSRFQFGSDYELEVGQEGPGTEERLLQKVRAERLYAALSRMKPTHAVVLTMIDLEGIQLDDAATLLDLPALTVRSRLRRARADLSSRLKKDRFFGAAACTNSREPGGSEEPDEEEDN